VPRPVATLSILQVAQIGTKVSAWFHAFVQNANDFKDFAPPRAIVNDAHRLPDALAAPFASRMS
jgi:hypothetical protein